MPIQAAAPTGGMAQYGEPEWHRRRTPTATEALTVAGGVWHRWAVWSQRPPSKDALGADLATDPSSMIKTTSSSWVLERRNAPDAPLQKICCACRKPAVPRTFRSPSPAWRDTEMPFLRDNVRDKVESLLQQQSRLNVLNVGQLLSNLDLSSPSSASPSGGCRNPHAAVLERWEVWCS